ncbi:hypothetical protein A8C32_10335 [Flavivirga aquatica]|uniref:Uncharacterized protein n=1 Tax=Flavivirga aquatica TaxID=1849968 RepID=A0A1E5TCK9_9FLAO|nr:hypothetical protein A8C32_10335 [Flavivirga aquatica]
MKKKINILLFIIVVVICHYFIEFLYRAIFYSISYSFDIDILERMAINMTAYHFIFNIFFIPFLLILKLYIKQVSFLFLLSFIFVLIMSLFWMKEDFQNTMWYLKYNFSLSVASFILLLISLVYIPKFMKN